MRLHIQYFAPTRRLFISRSRVRIPKTHDYDNPNNVLKKPFNDVMIFSRFQLVLRLRLPDAVADDAGRHRGLRRGPRHLPHPQGAARLHRPTGRKLNKTVVNE